MIIDSLPPPPPLLDWNQFSSNPFTNMLIEKLVPNFRCFVDASKKWLPLRIGERIGWCAANYIWLTNSALCNESLLQIIMEIDFIYHFNWMHVVRLLHLIRIGLKIPTKFDKFDVSRFHLGNVCFHRLLFAIWDSNEYNSKTAIELFLRTLKLTRFGKLICSAQEKKAFLSNYKFTIVNRKGRR